ncbi:MAG: DNRLRE domain-containing protein [Ginsengibacter sp.]
MKLSTFTLIFFASYLLPATSDALTYYVSPTGKNSNAGTSILKPWQTIAQVNKKNFVGDTILFQGGSTFTGNLWFTSLDKGTPSKPIVIGSFGTGRATISSGTGFGIYLENAAGFKIKNLNIYGSGVATNTKSGIVCYLYKDSIILPYLKFDSLEVKGYRDPGIIFGSSKDSSGYSDVSITNCDIHDNGRAGISSYGVRPYINKNVYIGYTKVYNNAGISTDTIGNSGSGIVIGNIDGAVIEYCTSYNNGSQHLSPNGGPNGIWAYLSNNVVVQYNESHHNKTGTQKDGGGFDFDGGCTNSIMQYNYSHDNYGGGYLIANYSGAPILQNIIIRYNISENDGRNGNYGALHIWSASSSSGLKLVEFYNNTVYMTPSSITSATPAAVLIRAGVYTGIGVRNNIFHTTEGVQMVQSSATTGFRFEGNDYWTTGSPFKIVWGATTYISLSAWRTATGGQEKINNVASGFQLDPQFSNTTTGVTFNDATKLTTLTRYKLNPASGLTIKGLNLSELLGINVGSTDFWRNNITGKKVFNIGAYQENTTAALAPSADAYVRNGPYAAINYGSKDSLEVKASTTGYTRYSYLKFSLTGVSDVISAKLRVYGRNTQNTTSINIGLFSVNDDSWIENGITWNNAPVPATFQSSAGINDKTRYYEFDVTDFVNTQFAGDKVVTFFIKDTANKNIQIALNSKEKLLNPPELIIATTALARPAIVRVSEANKIVEVEKVSELSLSPKVYPNPVQKRFTIELKNKYGGDFYIQMEDESGRVHNLGKRSLLPGQSKINVDIFGLYLTKGVYMLKIYSLKSKATVTKLLIQ